MSRTSHENWEPGDEAKESTETGEQEQIMKHQQSDNVKGDSTIPSGGERILRGGETQQVLSADSEEVNEENHRSRTLFQRATQNAIQTRLTELTKEGKTLKTSYQSVEKVLLEGPLPKDFDIQLSTIKSSYTKYKDLLEELISLLEKDKWGDHSEKAQEYVNYGKEILDFALKAINEGSVRWKSSEIALYVCSWGTRRSTISRGSSSSSASARRKAMAEAAAAKKKAEFDRMVAVREKGNYLKPKKSYTLNEDVHNTKQKLRSSQRKLRQ